MVTIKHLNKYFIMFYDEDKKIFYCSIKHNEHQEENVDIIS